MNQKEIPRRIVLRVKHTGHTVDYTEIIEADLNRCEYRWSPETGTLIEIVFDADVKDVRKHTEVKPAGEEDSE